MEAIFYLRLSYITVIIKGVVPVAICNVAKQQH